MGFAMHRIHMSWPGGDERPRWDRGAVAALIVGVGCLAAAGAASAAEAAAGQAPLRQFPLGQVFAMLFLMLGPFKIVGPFFKVTQGADARLTRQIALWATVFSALALLVAGFLGENILSSYGIPLPVLALAGGIILFLVALKNVLEQFEAPESHAGQAGAPPAAAMKVAMAPLAFPTIVTPYGIAAVVVLVAFSQTLQGRLAVGAVVVAIMVLNLIVMLVARRLQTVLAFVLPIFGAVLGVVQVALGLQIINNALHMLGVL
ncbi:MAG: MarC family protein [Burkholderiales bacterium]